MEHSQTRLTLEESVELTKTSLTTHGTPFLRWLIAFSGGKDSSVLITVLCYLLQRELIEPPQAIHVLMSNTRQEFPPLFITAQETLKSVERFGISTEIVEPPLDSRFFVYMFGVGVPPPKNKGFRWCTRKLKKDPMDEAVLRLYEQYGQEMLMLTGVRQGESAIRDQRIALACSKDGGECGQGWFQNGSREGIVSTLAPLLHWRLCNIEDWLQFHTPTLGFDLKNLLEIYGFGEGEQSAEAMNLRTGCAGCPLVQEDRALNHIITLPQWAYLAPLLRLGRIYPELNKPHNRLRKWLERNANGEFSKKQGRLGPLTMAARRWGLAQVKQIQDEINAVARQMGRPEFWLITSEEEARILQLIEANTWPQRWTGEEQRGDETMARLTLLDRQSVAVQASLFG